MVNCAVLTFAPPFIVYKASKLAEYGAYLLVLYAALAYLATQAVKMLLYATFVPTIGLEEDAQFHLLYEVLKSLVNAGDIVGLYLMLGFKKAGAADVRVMAVGLGWSVAESVVQRLAPLWMGARQLEFVWDHALSAVDANLSLVRYMALAALVWLWTRSRQEDKHLPSVTYAAYAIGAHYVFPVVLSFINLALGGGQLLSTAISCIFTGVFTVAAWHMFHQHQSPRQQGSRQAKPSQ